jgi:hypothetical protein
VVIIFIFFHFSNYFTKLLVFFNFYRLKRVEVYVYGIK